MSWLRLGVGGAGVFLGGILAPLFHRPTVPLIDPRSVDGGDNVSLEVVIPAYHESSVIGETIESIRSDLDRFGLQFKITVVAADPATVRASAGADSVIVREAAGKADAINAGVLASSSDLILLTDANCSINPPDWPRIALNALEVVDLVSSVKRETGGSDGVFWMFENLVKRGTPASARLSLGVVGEFMMFRRRQFRAIDDRVLSDDLQIAMDFNVRGLKVGVLSRISTTEVAASAPDQWERRVRIAAGQLGEALPRTRELFRTPAGRSYLSHKMYRLTFGCMGFWVGVAGFCSVVPIIPRLISIAFVARAVLCYAGVLQPANRLDPISTVIGLQAVPVAGAFRAISRLRRRTGEWKKVQR